jgi:hypothetical protein
MAAKALEMFETGRVVLRQPWMADVLSTSGNWHTVTFTTSGWRCSCEARVGYSHALAAMAAYAEVER